MITNTSLPIKGINYLYPYDFSAHVDVLETQIVGEQPNDDVTALLSLVTSDPWSKTAEPGYNLIDAVVEYHGANDRTGRPTNSRFSHIMIIRLGEFSTQVQGRIYLHYNA